MLVLVTGAAGFIGSNLTEELLRKGHQVVGFDNFHPFYEPAIKWHNLEQSSLMPGFRLIEGDIRDRSALRGIFESCEVDAVVHLAAMAGVRPSIHEPLLYADVNLTGTMVLLEEMRDAKVGRLVFGSSSSVYGGSADVPFREDQPADRPVSPYAATKRRRSTLPCSPSLVRSRCGLPTLLHCLRAAATTRNGYSCVHAQDIGGDAHSVLRRWVNPA